MARGINKVILVGNLGNDPEMRETQAGKAVATLSLATSDSWTDKQTGQRQEKTEWHRVVLFDRLGEVAGQYLRKGSKVYIEGRLQTRKWQNQQGQDQYTTEIIGSDMQMLDSRSEGAAQAPQTAYQAQPQAQAAAAPQAYQAPQPQAQPQAYQASPQQQAQPNNSQQAAVPQAYQQQAAPQAAYQAQPQAQPQQAQPTTTYQPQQQTSNNLDQDIPF